MSSRVGSHGRSKRAAIGVVIALSFFGFAGCGTPSNTPEAYDSTVETNFMNGCTATAPAAETGDTGESLGQGASTEYCQCSYNWYVNNVPYSDGTTTTTEGQPPSTTNPQFADFNFTSINSDLANDPESLPEAIKTGLSEACGSSEAPKTPGTTTPTTVGAEVDTDNTAGDGSSTTSTPG